MARGAFTYLKTLFTADTTGLRKGVKDAEKDVESFSTKVSGGLGKLGAAAAAAFSIGAIVNFGKQAAAAADIELQAQQKLLVALKGRQDTTENIIKLASELQKTTLFGDEDTVNAAAQLAIFVKEEEQLKKLIPVVQDFAQARNIDLAQAAAIVGKSVGSSTNALKRYGITIEGAAGSAARAESAISALTSKFEGQAAAAAQVGLGPFKILQNMIGDVVEDIGKWLMPAIQNISKALMKAFPTGIVDSFRSKIIDLINWFIELYNESTLVRGSIQLIGSVFNVVWETAKGFFTLAINGFKGFAEIIKATLTGDFKSIPEIFKSTMLKINSDWQKGSQDIVNNFAKAWDQTFKPREKVSLIDKTKAPQAAYKEGFQLGESFSDGVDDAIEKERKRLESTKTVGIIKAMPFSITARTGTEKQENINKLIDSNTEQYNKNLSKTELGPSARFKEINDQLEAEKQRMQDILTEINSIIESTMEDMVVSFAEGFGNLLATGSFGDLGKVLLGSLADMMIQLGKLAIQSGITIEAIKSAFATLGGPLAIAAGAALVALGTAIKGSISGLATGGGSYSGSSGGGGTYDTRSFRTSGSLNAKPQPVAVTVSGETTIRNKDIYIAFKNAESSKKMNT